MLGIVAIGQTPRPDIERACRPYAGGAAICIVGALDGLTREEIRLLENRDGPYPLLRGGADLAAGIGIEGGKRLAEAGGATAHERESGLCIIFMLNAQKGPCTDRRVRQALSYALDVDAIIAGVMNGGRRASTGT